jgi:hypothetical protein
MLISEGCGRGRGRGRGLATWHFAHFSIPYQQRMELKLSVLFYLNIFNSGIRFSYASFMLSNMLA